MLDDLMYYADRRARLVEKLLAQMKRYRFSLRKLDEASIGKFTAQYVTHAIFRKKGLIHQYLDHSYCRNLSNEHRSYLEFCADHPWRYSFSVIKKSPEPDFFEMEDVFTGESFLLYSPGTQDTLQDYLGQLWFNLINFNGLCWQTFGPICGFTSFFDYDIQYYTSLLNQDKWHLEVSDITDYIEKNPLPYFLLSIGSTLPLATSQGELLINNIAEYDFEGFEWEKLGSKFQVERKAQIIKFQLKHWDNLPHFAMGYYDLSKSLLRLSALTDKGFRQLILQLNKLGNDLAFDADYRVGMTMASIAHQILRKDLTKDPYEHLFRTPTTPKQDETIDRINHFMDLLVPLINDRKAIDVKDLAERTGLDLKVAKEIAADLQKKLGL